MQLPYDKTYVLSLFSFALIVPPLEYGNGRMGACRTASTGATTRGQDVIRRITSPPTAHPGSSGTPLKEPSQAKIGRGVTPLTGVVEAETGDVPCFFVYGLSERGVSY